MIKPKIYLDTTVISAYFDKRTPERQEYTKEFWTDRLSEFEVYISDLVLIEIRDTPDPDLLSAMEDLVKDFIVLTFNEEIDKIVSEYIDKSVFSEKSKADARHTATAVVNGIDYLISWNFKHIVKVKTRRLVNYINTLSGYQVIEIISPPEL